MAVETEIASSSTAERGGTQWQALGWPAFFFAVLQSICTAFMVLSGLRLVVGAGALVAAVGVQKFEQTGIHDNRIRYPMLVLACLGSAINLLSIWRVRRLRGKPAAQWRVKPVTRQTLRAERIQIVLSLLTLVLVGLEWTIHHHTHGG